MKSICGLAAAGPVVGDKSPHRRLDVSPPPGSIRSEPSGRRTAIKFVDSIKAY